MKIKLFKTLEKYKTLYNKDKNGREINIYKVENCIPSGMNLFYPSILLKPIEKNNEFVAPLLERTMSLQMDTNSLYEQNKISFECNDDIKSIYTNPVFFFIYNTDNYFHFIYDSLPYLISFLDLKKNIPTLKLLIQYPNEQKKEFYPFVLEFLEILNITKEDIVIVDKFTQYKSIYISTSYTHDIDSNLPPRKEIYDFYKDIVNRVKEKYTTNNLNAFPKKIYVSRRTHLHNDFSNIGTNYTTRRKMVNEDEYVTTLLQEGYAEVFTEKLTTVEKILYFANATHVVGAIGGGISNVLFSPSITKLEAIISPFFLDVNQRFKYSLNCVDVTYNMKTAHIETGEFKRYMRIKSKDGKIIGEIEEINENDNKLLVSYTENNCNTGWNLENKYKQLELNMSDVDRLDKGLNSAWYLL